MLKNPHITFTGFLLFTCFQFEGNLLLACYQTDILVKAGIPLTLLTF